MAEHEIHPATLKPGDLFQWTQLLEVVSVDADQRVEVKVVGTDSTFYIQAGVFPSAQKQPEGFDPALHSTVSGMFHSRQHSRTVKVTATELQRRLRDSRNQLVSVKFRKKCDLKKNILGMRALAAQRGAGDPEIRAHAASGTGKDQLAKGLRALADVVEGATAKRARELLDTLGSGDPRELEGIYLGQQESTGRFRMVDLRVLSETGDWARSMRQVDPRTVQSLVSAGTRYEQK